MSKRKRGHIPGLLRYAAQGEHPSTRCRVPKRWGSLGPAPKPQLTTLSCECHYITLQRRVVSPIPWVKAHYYNCSHAPFCTIKPVYRARNCEGTVVRPHWVAPASGVQHKEKVRLRRSVYCQPHYSTSVACSYPRCTTWGKNAPFAILTAPTVGLVVMSENSLKRVHRARIEHACDVLVVNEVFRCNATNRELREPLLSCTTCRSCIRAAAAPYSAAVKAPSL